MIMPPEDGEWKIVHRHVDAITTARPAESVIQRYPVRRAREVLSILSHCHKRSGEKSTNQPTNQPLLRIAFISVVTERQNRQNVPIRPRRRVSSHCSPDRIDRTGLPDGWVHEERV
jgi:hypothetical protein